MNRSGLVVFYSMVFVLLAALNGTAWAGGNVNFMFGQKYLDEDDWDPVEEQREYGLMLDFKANDNWPFSIAMDLLFSDDDGDYYGAQIEGETREFNLGIRKYFPVTAQVKPYVGGGLAYISTKFSGTYAGIGASDDDSEVGFWLGGGVVCTFAGNINIGVDLRYSQAEVTMFDVDGEAGGNHLLVFAGLHF